MKLYVCKNCGYNIQELTRRNSFRREGKDCCTTCGGVLNQEEVDEDGLKKLNKENRKWVGSRVFWFELALGLFLLAIIFGGQR